MLMSNRLTVFASILLGLLSACAPKPENVNRVQTNLVEKGIFEGEWWYSSSVVVLASTRSRTSPPRPPFPPSGPPSGLNFSRCTDEQPWPRR